MLRENGVEPTVVEYLKTPLTENELEELLKMLGIPAERLIRKGESIYKEQFKGKETSEADWVAAMAAHPKLMERPIVVAGKKAVIGRPPESVRELL